MSLATHKDPEAVREMFARIAYRYDLLNRVLSFGRDRTWRERLADRVSPPADGRALDICSGTGDVAQALATRHGRLGSIHALDAAPPMLAIAREKRDRNGRAGAGPVVVDVVGDALALPYRDKAFDLVTCAFGVRNFVSLGDGLAELVRVLAPGGELAVLELCGPTGAGALCYRAALSLVVPLTGAVLARDWQAYRYLGETIRHFVPRDQLAAALEVAGTEDIEWHDFTGGVATLFVARRPGA